MNVTRNVVADLWALAAAGDASEESKRLIDAFFEQDPEFGRVLRDQRSNVPAAAPPDLPPDHETRTFQRAKLRLRKRSPLYLLALVLTGLAGARILEDTAFTSSPTRFVVTASAALVCWMLHAWHTQRLREGAL